MLKFENTQSNIYITISGPHSEYKLKWALKSGKKSVLKLEISFGCYYQLRCRAQICFKMWRTCILMGKLHLPNVIVKENNRKNKQTNETFWVFELVSSKNLTILCSVSFVCLYCFFVFYLFCIVFLGGDAKFKKKKKKKSQITEKISIT